MQQYNVTAFMGFNDKAPKVVPFFDVLHAIKTGYFGSVDIAKKVNEIKSCFAEGGVNCKKNVERIKKGLPFIKTLGVFTSENDDSINTKSYTGLFQVDIDHALLPKISGLIRFDEYVLAFFKSPSGNYKAIVKSDNRWENHKDAFESVKRYFWDAYEITVDKQTGNIGRNMFLSYDPDIFVNKEFVPFDWKYKMPDGEFEAAAKESSKYIESGMMELKVSLQKIMTDDRMDRHFRRLVAGIKIGRYAAGEGFSETELEPFIMALSDQIADKNRTSKKESKAIKDGIKYGKTRPLTFESDSFVLHLRDLEFGDAKLILFQFNNTWKYNHTFELWMKRQNTIWVKDETMQCFSVFRDAITEYYQNAINVCSEGKIVTKINDRISKLKCLNYMNRVIDYAKTFQEMATVIDNYDSNKFEFVCENAIINLEEGVVKARQAGPKDLNIIKSDVKYDGKAKCPNFENFMAKIMCNDQDLVLYLQKVLGSCLTGRTDYQALFFFYGAGRNGKGTLIRFAQSILGGYAAVGKDDLLVKKKIKNNEDYFLADLRARRAVFVAEVDRDSYFDAQAVKRLTGQDKIKAREVYGKPFEFFPTFKSFLVCNGKPSTNDTSFGFWRRMKLIPFSYEFQENEMESDSRINAWFMPERSGVLNWFLRGYELFNADMDKYGNVQEPEAIRQAVLEYRSEQDIVREFFEITYEDGEDFEKIYVEEIHDDFIKFCNDRKLPNYYKSQRKFTSYLIESGMKLNKSSGNKYAIYKLRKRHKESEVNNDNWQDNNKLYSDIY